MLALMPRMTELLPRTEPLFGWMPEEFERLTNRLFRWPVMEVPEMPRPWAFTAEERENEVLVRAELPGFAPEEIRVEALANRLTVEAEHKVPAEGAPEAPEREHVRVRRVVTLPTGINPEAAVATFRNGVLEIHLPRTPEATPRRIAVNVEAVEPAKAPTPEPEPAKAPQ